VHVKILVVGSVALDTVETPAGARTDLLGGSATHFAVAASFFAPVRLVAVVGEDFGEERLSPFRERGVDLGGLARVPGGRTFRWSGRYEGDLNSAQTLSTDLNVFADFDPVLPPGWSSTPVVFLANIDPDLQGRVVDRMESPRLVAADTMNYWIAAKPEALRRTLRRVDVQFLNDGEARQLTGAANVVEAAHRVQDLGPRTVVVKRGEHGVFILSGDEPFALPGFPLRRVVDPTGAGDAFAGGFLGWTAAHLGSGTPDVRRAAVAGSVLASYQVEAFSLDRVRALTDADIRARFEAFERLTRFGAFEAREG
jgi:sugar/nucleoside kinase (ribokinase family)